jgi:hypothetical protein
MMRGATLRKFSSWLIASALMLFAPAVAWAQCAMCKTSAENMDPAGVKYLNIAMLLLLTPPVSIFCGFFYLAYKRRDAPRELNSEVERGERSQTERD